MDELDQLLTETFGTDTADAAPGPEEAAPDAVDATTAEDAAPPETEEAPPEPAPEDSPELTATAEADGTAPEATDPAPAQAAEPSPDLAALQAELERQRQVAQNQAQLLAAWQQEQERVTRERQEQQEAAALQAQVAALKGQWDQMDPDDAAKAREQFIYQTAQAEITRRDQQLAAIAQQQQAAALAAQEAAAKPRVIDHLIQTFKLTDADRATLDLFPDPVSMEAFARQTQAQRQAQTQAARQARAQQVADSKAFVQSGATGTAAAQTPHDFKDLDDLIENGIFAAAS